MESDQQKHPSSNEGTDLTLQDRLEQQKEWSRAVVYTSEGKILGTTFDVDLNEIIDLLGIFNDEENAFRFGIDIDNEHYDVHRFYDTLIYGRKGGEKTGDGVCICKIKEADGRSIYTLITYSFPTLSAKAVPELQEFCKKYVTPLL